MREDLINLKEVDELGITRMRDIYNRHINPFIPARYDEEGMSTYIPQSAEGLYIHLNDGRKVMDFTAGRSLLNLGHNHPRIQAVRKAFNQGGQMEVWKTFLSPYLGVLSKNMASIAPEGFNYSFFCNSGSEAVEGALKLAEKYQGKDKAYIIYTDLGRHGSTHGALSVSGDGPGKESFKTLDHCIAVPYGDADAFEQLIHEHASGSSSNDIIAVILEAVIYHSVEIPPESYLKKIRELCDRHNILLIIDEVSTGLGRTGKMFAFEHSGIAPDIFTVAKSLGGGKCSLGAYITKDEIFKKAYGSLNEALIHSTTFNGMGEECVTANEALKVLVEENLPENARVMGAYLKEGLKKCSDIFPSYIKTVEGVGLLLKLGFINNEICMQVKKRLFQDHNILLNAVAGEPSLHICPPLIIHKAEVDCFVKAVREVLSQMLSEE